MNRYPALYYGLAMIAGISLAQGIWPPLIFILFSRQRLAFLLITLFAALETLYFSPNLPTHRIDGVGYYRVEKIRNTDGSLAYQGRVPCFLTPNQIYYDIPCFFFPTDPLPPNSDFFIKGSLRPTQRDTYTLHATFEPLPNTYNLAHLRFTLKEAFRHHLKTHIADPLCYTFLASLGTGEIESRLLSLQFNKVGLTHTLAISGFHYTWLIFILGALFHLFFSKKTTCYFLLLLVSLYFFFIGETPSLNRAWMAALICLIGYLLKESVNGLNSLGLALLFSLILDPFALFQIGFQLSYLATFSLLALFPTINRALTPLFPTLTLARSTLAITLAVNLATLPLILYHFHYFPYLSLFFNLFFPLAITVCLIALIFSFFPFVLQLTELYTTPFLNMIFYGIDTLEGGLYIHHMPLDLLLASLLTVISLGLFLEHRYHLNPVGYLSHP